MEAHPDIFLHPKVDVGFFLDQAVMGRTWLDGEIDESTWKLEHSRETYAEMFADGEGKIAVGEKSADYFFWRPAHARMHDWIPDAKIILTLRNPIERAWSMYWNEVGKGRETLGFEEAIAAEPDRIADSAYARNHLSYLSRGEYAESLFRLYEFYPPEQVKVVILEDAMKDPVSVLQGVYGFLGLDPRQGLERALTLFNNNWTTVPRSFWTQNKLLESTEETINKLIRTAAKKAVRDVYARRRLLVKLEAPFRLTKKDFKIQSETRRKLEAHFAPHNRQLEELLGRDLSVWN